MNSPILNAALYAGLAGTLLALVVATAQQKWSCRVFFLLALRLAIGWQFLFEGLYKVNTHYTGPTETTRVFTSEPYFRVAPGPLGAYMRRQFENPEEVIAARLKPTKDTTPDAFAKLAVEEQAEACPEAVAKSLDAVKDEAAKDKTKADEAETKDVAEAKSDEGKAWAKTKADDARAAAAKKAEFFESAVGKELFTAKKAAYARWVFGVDGRNTKVKFITNDVWLTAPQRIAHLDWLRKEVKEAEGRQAPGLGNGSGIDQKRVAEFRTDLVAAESELVKDSNDFIADLKKELNGGKAVEETKPVTRGQRMDIFTMWFLVAVGAGLMAGLVTRVMCVLGAGFLLMTYLAHPAVPWYPLPPNTEGNPVFINKNIIECIALLALASMPTGRWLGLDALLMRLFFRGKEQTPGQPGAI